jgi:hypothetical protein
MTHIKSSLWLMLSVSLLVGCSRKFVPVPTTTPPPRTVELEEIDFDYLHGKARMVLKDEKNEREVKAHIRVRKDSVIWMTFTVMGVQGGKALINKDSITIVSTINKEYFVFDFTELSKRFQFQVDYQVIQSALLGNLIAVKSNTDQVSEDETFDILRQQQGNVSIKNSINKSNRKLEKVEMHESASDNSLSINYGNFQPLGDKSFPYNGTISILYKTITGIIVNNTTIIFEYGKVEVGDRELKFPFNIPKKYDRR